MFANAAYTQPHNLGATLNGLDRIVATAASLVYVRAVSEGRPKTPAPVPLLRRPSKAAAAAAPRTLPTVDGVATLAEGDLVLVVPPAESASTEVGGLWVVSASDNPATVELITVPMNAMVLALEGTKYAGALFMARDESGELIQITAPAESLAVKAKTRVPATPKSPLAAPKAPSKKRCLSCAVPAAAAKKVAA